MKQEKKGERAPRLRYTQLEEGDALIGEGHVYLVVRREGEGLTYLRLLGDDEPGLVRLQVLDRAPIDPAWEVIKRPWSF